MKNKSGDEWFPFWVDKWLFGSTRHEFSHAQRAIWADILVLSKKDGGYVRANEKVPYPLAQLAGLFACPIKLLTDTIHKAIEVGKLQQLSDGTLFVISTAKYTLSERHRRRVEKAIMSENTDIVSENTDTQEEVADTYTKSILEKSREDNIHPLPPQGDFEHFWKLYPHKVGKGAARKTWAKLSPGKALVERILEAITVQKESEQWLKEDGRFIPHPATWLNQERWDDEVKPMYNDPTDEEIDQWNATHGGGQQGGADVGDD